MLDAAESDRQPDQAFGNANAQQGQGRALQPAPPGAGGDKRNHSEEGQYADNELNADPAPAFALRMVDPRTAALEFGA